MKRRHLTGWFFGWFKVMDDAGNILALPNGTDPSKLDSWEFKIEIKQEDFAQFELCKRPDDFSFVLNGETATVTHDALPDGTIQAEANNGVTLKRCNIVYPDPVTEENRPYLVIQLIASPSSLPLSSNVITVAITDTANNDKIIDISADINTSFDRVTITDNGSAKLTPKSLNGTYFEVN